MEYFVYKEKSSLFWYPSQDFAQISGRHLRKRIQDSEVAVLCQDYQSHLEALSGQKCQIYSDTPLRRKAVQITVPLVKDEWKMTAEFVYFDPLTCLRLNPVLENGNVRYASDLGTDYPMKSSGFRQLPFEQSFRDQSTLVMAWKSDSFVLLLKR